MRSYTVETLAEYIARLQREDAGRLQAAKDRLTSVALEGVLTDGFPRVSGYTADVLVIAGLLERTGEDERPFRVTDEGRRRLDHIASVSPTGPLSVV